ncbi:MAG: FtsQ-type POTRA domain-containing protein, partial [Solobacterium sp.]|nr:FtsQ-type POTRA domain-containing protein [Solobacterium sp.]
MAKRVDENRKQDIPEGVQLLFDERHEGRINREYMNARPRLFRRGVLLAAILLTGLYFLLPDSRVQGVSFHGNQYLTDSYVKNVSGIRIGNLFYLPLPWIIEQKLNSDPFIESSQVKLKKGNIVEVTVTEKKVVGYRYDEDPVILFADHSTVPLKSEYLNVIAEVPLIKGFFESEQTRLLIKGFENVDKEIISEISEITQYDLGYDAEAILVLMRNGGYFIASYRSLPLIDQYNAIYSHLENRDLCIFADDNLSTAYAKACPWDEPETTFEYWKDENGELIRNTYGDPVYKHYYVLEDYSPALDEKGNPIPIPLNSRGFEDKDPDFLENYEAGYYKTGKLVMPTEEEKKEMENKKEE